MFGPIPGAEGHPLSRSLFTLDAGSVDRLSPAASPVCVKPTGEGLMSFRPFVQGPGRFFSTIPRSGRPNGGHSPLCQRRSEQIALMSAWREHRRPQRRSPQPSAAGAFRTIWKTICSLMLSSSGWVKECRTMCFGLFITSIQSSEG